MTRDDLTEFKCFEIFPRIVERAVVFAPVTVEYSWTPRETTLNSIKMLINREFDRGELLLRATYL